MKNITARKQYLLLGLFFLLVCLFPGHRELNSSLVTTSLLVSARSTTLTIYQTQELCLVQEHYPVNFKPGANYVQFILPQTADKQSLQLSVLNRVDAVHVQEAILSPASNRVLWKIEASQHLEVELEIAYFMRGISWNIIYDIDIDAHREKMVRFSGTVSVENRNEQDFTQASLILVTGSPQVLPEEMKKEERSFERIQALRMDEAQPPEITKEAISEYYAYQIEGSRQLEGQARVSFELFSSYNLPYRLIYQFNFDQWGAFPHAVYEFENQHTFPLPPGPVRFWSLRDEARAGYLGRSELEYVAQGQDIKLSIAENTGMKLERRMSSFSRAGLEFGFRKNLVSYHEEEAYSLGVSSFLDKEVTVRITETIPGEWKFIEASIPITRKEVNALEFELNVPPAGEGHVTYTVQKIFRSR